VKLLKTLPVILFSVTACGKLPPKPEGELCELHHDSHIAQCSDIRTGKISEKPHKELSIAVTAKTWENIVAYQVALKKIVRERCR